MTQYNPDLYRNPNRMKPADFGPSQLKSDRLDQAHRALARMDRHAGGGDKAGSVQTTGIEAVDMVLPRGRSDHCGSDLGGLALGAMHEVLGLAARRFVTGIVRECLADPAAPPILWVVPVMAGHCLYGPGLAQRGVDPARLVIARYRTARDGLWTLEEALKSGAFSAVLGDLSDPLSATAARRLHLAAEAGGSLGLILSEGTVPLTAPGSVTSRWRAEPASADAEDGIGRCFHLSLDRHRGHLGAGYYWTVQDGQ